MNNELEKDEQYSELVIDDAVFKTRLNRMYTSRKPYVPHDPRLVTSFMPGNIQDVFVQAGDQVKEGDRLCILEAMKMKNVIIAPMDGVIRTVNVVTGTRVAKNHVLVEMV